MHLNFVRACYAMAMLLLLAATAIAGPLPTDPNAYNDGSNPTWRGMVALIDTSHAPANVLHAEVEYAVYAPGQFSASAALGHPADPSGGADYIYAYEVFDDAAGGSNVTVKTLSIGVDYVSFPNALPMGASWVTNAMGAVGGLAPVSSRFSPSPQTPSTHSVLWSYPGTLNPGNGSSNHSNILFFASPWVPKFALSSVLGGGTGGIVTQASANLPSPIPEPATAVLAVIAAICLLVAKCARRRTI